MNLTPITGQLDSSIAPIVEALRRAGFDTTASCDGHDSWQGVPWVNVGLISRSRAFGTLGLEGKTVARLLSWCDEHNVAGNVCRVYTTVNGERHEYIRLEVLSELREARL